MQMFKPIGQANNTSYSGIEGFLIGLMLAGIIAITIWALTLVQTANAVLDAF